MPRVFVTIANREERSALRLLLLDLDLLIVGEATDWPTTLTEAPAVRPDMLLVDSNLLAVRSGPALDELRQACEGALIVVLISHLDARQQAAVAAGADVVIYREEAPDRIAERLRAAITGTYS